MGYIIMKKSKFITLGLLLVSTSQIFADTLTERVTALESAKVATKVGGIVQVKYTSKGVGTTLGDVELYIKHTINEQFDGHFKLERRGGDNKNTEDDITLGVAGINYHNANFNASIGRIGTPFGSYATGMVTDPLTKGIDSDKSDRNGLVLSKTLGDIKVSVYANEKDKGTSKGISANYTNGAFSTGVYYFNGASSNGIRDAGTSKAIRLDYKASNGLSAAYENVKTNKDVNIKKSASHVEVGYAHQMMATDASITLAYSRENATAGNKKQTGVTYNLMPTKGTTVSLESNKLKGSSSINTLKVSYSF
jgi:hypothetical protein